MSCVCEMFHVILGTPNDEMATLRRYTAFNWLFSHGIHMIFPEVRLFLSEFFYVLVIVYRNNFLYNKTNHMHQFPKFTPA